jgi:nitrite reductase/ring-hydroxylating ferredoxin subunit
MATVRVARVSEVSPGTGKVVGTDGRSIALFNVDGVFYAIDNTCTHRGGPLGEGALIGETGAQFNIRTGAVTRPPAPSGVRSYPVKVEGDEVFVDLD